MFETALRERIKRLPVRITLKRGLPTSSTAGTGATPTATTVEKTES